MQILHKNTHTYCFVCHPTSSSCQGEKTDINRITLTLQNIYESVHCDVYTLYMLPSVMILFPLYTPLKWWILYTGLCCFHDVFDCCVLRLVLCCPLVTVTQIKKKKYYTCIHMFYIPSFLVLWHGERSKLKHFYDYSPCTQIRSLSTIFNCMLKEFLWLFLFINQKSKITCTCNFPAEYYIYI